MSNRRHRSGTGRYRDQFLHSPAWHARRARWFHNEHRRRGTLACVGCGRAATEPELELHHLTYRGVTQVSGVWRAFEAHQDLTPMHPWCHGMIHRIIDRDHGLSSHRTRRDATTAAIRILRTKLARGTEEVTE